ncbi:Alpha/Beta hydrolase protein [Pholiota molesta]|nr:Alpha/Beta hydrolase protein [Pholiota molesta]
MPNPTSYYPIIRFGPNPTTLRVKKTNRDGSDAVSIKTLLETHVPSLFKEYRPTWWLFNGHLQTAYCVGSTFSKQDSVAYHRTHLLLADGGTIGLDFAPADQSNVRNDAPIVVIQHGLAGGSHEHYIREILTKVFVVNFRGCSGVPITSPMFYSAGSTDDTRQALMYLNHKYPDAPLLGLGFSLGANLLTRYLGEEGERSKLKAGAALGCPWDLKRNGESLVSSVLGKHVYSKAMGGGLMRLLRKHLVALTKDPDHAEAPAPLPIPDVMTFYNWVSSHTMLDHIRVPFLSINAEDDPVIKHVPLEDSENGYLTMVLTRHGGHLGWFQSGPRLIDRWTTKPVMEWLKLIGQDIVQDSTPAPALSIDADGFLREEGSPTLGCKVVDEKYVHANSYTPEIWRYKLLPGLQSLAAMFSLV